MEIGGNGIVIESWKEHSKSSLVTLVFASLHVRRITEKKRLEDC